MSHRKHYQIRDKYHQITHNLSKNEIISRIKSREYSGEEEIYIESKRQWVPLVSIPLFFQHFAKGILGKADADEVSIHREDRDQELTAQSIKESLAKDSLHTVQISSAGKGLPEDLSYRDLFEESSQEFHVAHSVPSQEKKEKKKRRKINKRKKSYLMAGLCLACFLWIFLSGEKDDDTFMQTSLSSQFSREVSESEAGKISKALLKESQNYFSQDVPMYYSFASVLIDQVLGLPTTQKKIPLERWAEYTAWEYYLDSQRSQNKSKIEKSILTSRKNDPHSSRLYRAQALIYMKDKAYKKSKEEIKKAIQTDPLSPANALVLGQLSLHLEDYQSAVISLKEAQKERTTFVRSSYLLAKIELSLGNYDIAYQYVQNVLQNSPNHMSSILLLADIYVAQGKLESAFDTYSEAVILGKLFGKVYVRQAFQKMAKLKKILGQLKSAEKFLAYAYVSDPRGAKKDEMLSRYKEHASQYSSSKIEKMLFQPADFLKRGEAFLEISQTLRALEDFRAAYVLDNQHPDVLRKLASAHKEVAISYDDLVIANYYYQTSISTHAKDYESFIDLGLIETDQFNFKRGYELLSQAIALQPDQPRVYVSMGKHFYKRKDYTKASELFIKAGKLLKNNPDSQLESQVLYYAAILQPMYKKETQKESLDLFQRAYFADPFHYEALRRWMVALVKNYNKNHAIKFIKNLIIKSPLNSQYYWILGEIYLNSDDPWKAIQYYKKGLKLDSRNVHLRKSLAEAWVELKDMPKAIAEYQLSSELDHSQPGGYFKAAQLLYKTKQFVQAEQTIKKLIKIYPHYPGAHLLLGKIYIAHNKKDKGVRELKTEVKNNPYNTKYRITLAEILMRYGDFKDAVRQLSAISNLPHPEKAPEYTYDKVRGFLLLSQSYRALSQFESAEGAIQLALEIDPQDPLLHKELGYVYVGLQRNKDAVKRFEYYLDRKPSAVDSGRMKKLIKTLVIPE